VGVSFDRIAERYDETRGGEERAANFAAELAPQLAPGPLLELGVGTGIVAQALGAHGRQPFGVDIAAAMLVRAHQRLGARIARYDGRSLPFRDAAFAAAYAVWVMHLVEDQEGLLREMARVLRPGGRFVIEPLNYPADDEIERITWPMLQTLLGERAGRDDLDRLSRLAASAGLLVVGRVPGQRLQLRVTAAQEVTKIERRDSAIYWDLDEQRWQEVVEPALQRLRALGDLEVERDAWHEMLLLERKAG
jgi:SAM-dependent methyltransferase